MTDKINPTEGDLARLLDALDAEREDDEMDEAERSAAELDSPEGQARLERLWKGFLSAAATSRSEELAMNENVQMKRELLPSVEYNQIADAWVGAVAERQNEDLRRLVNSIGRNTADQHLDANQSTREYVERIVLADGRVVTRSAALE